MKNNSTWHRWWFAPCLALVVMLLGQTVANAVPMIGLTLDNKLVLFDSDTPGTILQTIQVTGLHQGEVLHGIDFRSDSHVPTIYGIGSSGRFYHIDRVTGIATEINNTAFTPKLNGGFFGVDFNPTVDLLRVVSERDQNLRINPVDGTVASVDAPLAFAVGDPNEGADPNVTAVAYTNNFQFATKTTLYGIDYVLNVLVRIGGPNGNPSPNTGVLTTIGPLGVAAGKFNGFDISPGTNTAYAAFRGVGGISRLYTINLNTGQATLVGTVTGNSLRGLAIFTWNGIFCIATTADNHLIIFNVAEPGSLRRTETITGLQPGETILGVDYRTSNVRLYGLGSTGRLYDIDTGVGTTTEVGMGPFAVPLSGTSFGFDFNPVADRIRVVSDAEQNFRLNPDDGTVAGVDAPLAFAMGDPNEGVNPNVAASAYTNNIFGGMPATTTLYGIDTNLDILVRQGNPSPNDGQLTTIGSLGVNAVGPVAFDIMTFEENRAQFVFAALSGQNGISRLFVINLATGRATQIGVIGGNKQVIGMSLVPD